MIVIGVDPGKTGAAAMLFDSGNAQFFTWEGRKLLAAILNPDTHGLGPRPPCFAAVELPLFKKRGEQRNPKNEASLWRSHGQWMGFLSAFGIEAATPTPQEWQTIFHGYPGESTKIKMQKMLKTEYPALEKLCWGPGSHPGCASNRPGWLDGKGDALGIALWLKAGGKASQFVVRAK